MAAFHPLSSQVIRAIHVGFVLLLIFTLYPPFGSHLGGLRRMGRSIGWALGAVGFATGLYQWVFEADLTLRAGELIALDWVVGIAAIALVFEAARRVMGLGLPLISLLGYQPGVAGTVTQALSLAYAALPCLIKTAAAWLLWRLPNPDLAAAGPTSHRMDA
jgi:TRAP-type uncharacterized transport system fused permease subunit